MKFKTLIKRMQKDIARGIISIPSIDLLNEKLRKLSDKRNKPSGEWLKELQQKIDTGDFIGVTEMCNGVDTQKRGVALSEVTLSNGKKIIINVMQYFGIVVTMINYRVKWGKFPDLDYFKIENLPALKNCTWCKEPFAGYSNDRLCDWCQLKKDDEVNFNGQRQGFDLVGEGFLKNRGETGYLKEKDLGDRPFDIFTVQRGYDDKGKPIMFKDYYYYYWKKENGKWIKIHDKEPFAKINTNRIVDNNKEDTSSLSPDEWKSTIAEKTQGNTTSRIHTRKELEELLDSTREFAQRLYDEEQKDNSMRNLGLRFERKHYAHGLSFFECHDELRRMTINLCGKYEPGYIVKFPISDIVKRKPGFIEYRARDYPSHKEQVQRNIEKLFKDDRKAKLERDSIVRRRMLERQRTENIGIWVNA